MPLILQQRIWYIKSTEVPERIEDENLKILCIESVSVCQSNCENLLAEYTYFFFCKTTDIFYATKENNVAQFKIKVEIAE